MSHESELDRRVQVDITKDLALHAVTTLHDNGLYRHYRCAKSGTGIDHFDIVTWPDFLAFTGDRGEYIFERVPDMIPFMRRSCMSYAYMEEKCVAHGANYNRHIKEFSHEVLQQIIDGEVKDIKETYPDYATDCGLTERLETLEELRHHDEEHEAIQALHDSDIWDGCDLPDCTAYSYSFLWCLHAIKWFCAKVEQPK